jgi:hypothetical protein
MVPRIPDGLSSRYKRAISVSFRGFGEDDLLARGGYAGIFAVAMQKAAVGGFHVRGR